MGPAGDSVAFQRVVSSGVEKKLKYSIFLRKRFAKKEKVRTFAIPKRSGLRMKPQRLS